MASDPSAELLEHAYGYVVSQALSVAARLRVADHLRAGPRSVEGLAREGGTQAAPLQRVLRLLVSRGIFSEPEDGVFANTPLSEGLIGSDSVRDAVALAGHPIFWNSVGRLIDAVKTGHPAFDIVFGGGFFEHLAHNAEARDVFNAGMHRTSVAENAAIARSFDFGRFATVADVGGGRGGFLLEILKNHPNVRGILFDSPEVVEESCVLHGEIPDGRYQVVGGNFFESAPVLADAILLKRVLHDWDDAQCVRILSNCAQSMRPGNTVIAFEAVLEPDVDPGGRKVSDVLLLTLLPGKERTLEEFRSIFDEARLSLDAVVPTGTGLFGIEGRLRGTDE